jgi:hypothetical protein
MAKPITLITVEDLGLTQKQINQFVKGARIAYGQDPLASEKPTPSVPEPFTPSLPKR